MADVVVFVGGIGYAEGNGNDVRYGGDARVAGMSPTADNIPWVVLVDIGVSRFALNTAIINAAVSAVQAAGFIVGPSDKTILMAAAV